MEELQLIYSYNHAYSTNEGECEQLFLAYINDNKFDLYNKQQLLNGEITDTEIYVSSFDTLNEVEEYIENNLI